MFKLEYLPKLLEIVMSFRSCSFKISDSNTNRHLQVLEKIYFFLIASKHFLSKFFTTILVLALCFLCFCNVYVVGLTAHRVEPLVNLMSFKLVFLHQLTGYLKINNFTISTLKLILFPIIFVMHFIIIRIYYNYFNSELFRS